MIPPFMILSMLLMIPLVACAKDENLLTLESWGNGAPELSISVPLGYTVKRQKGPDFDVHYIELKNANDPSMGIYIGHHPNPFSSKEKAVDTTKEADIILGQKVEWVSWQGEPEGKGSYHCETVIANVFKGIEGGGVAGLLIHVFINGSDKKQIHLLKTSAKSLQIVHTGGKSMNTNRVIFSAEEAGRIGYIFGGKAPFWKPTDNQVQELESLLPKYLNSHPPVNDKPVGNFFEYGRQYFGVTKNGRRSIYLNAFCKPSRFDPRWQKEIIVVEDGGSCCFQVYFDPATKEFIDLRYNGQA